MKLQIPDEGLESNREGENYSFFNELDIETRTMLVTYVSFFNEVATEMKKKLSSRWFHFLTSLKSKNHAQRPLFHFLMRLPQRFKNYPRNLCFICNEVAAEMQKLSSISLFLIMDSKRTILWKDTMSRDKT
jgi:hypothetical protein